MNANQKEGHPSNPASASEARITKIMYGQRTLRTDDCPTCKRAMENPREAAPYHDASSRCESGHRTHCSCDTCF